MSSLNKTGYFFGADRRRLFYQSWQVQDPKGIAFITHGLSENTDRYDRLAHVLNEDGWNVYAWDLRGHGRSSGIRGYIRKFRLFERDLIHFVHFVFSKEKQGLPFVFIGHSLGGLILARALYHEENAVMAAGGICLLAPALGLTMNVPIVKLVLGYFSYYLCPWLVYYDRILSKNLTRDPYFQKTIENDPFCHRKISPEIYFTMLRSSKIMEGEFRPVSSRMLLQVGGKDKIVDHAESQKIFDRIPSNTAKQMIVYPSSLHQLLEDYDSERVMKDLKMFIRPLIVRS